VPNSCSVQLLDEAVGVHTHVITHDKRAGESAVYPDEDARRASAEPNVESSCGLLCAGVAALVQPGGAANGDAPPVNRPFDALAPSFVHALRRNERETTRFGVVHERFCENMRGELVDRGSKA
jgi:hypothetical protein